MGLFDSVYVNCPKCDHRLDFQSKAGQCSMLEYETDAVPVSIVGDLDGSIEVCKCGSKVKIYTMYKFIEMRVKIVGNETDG